MKGIIQRYREALRGDCELPKPLPSLPPLKDNAHTVLLFSPHPDDECVTGAATIRLRREAKARVINVAVTLGSNQARQEERREELAAACQTLGFDQRELAFSQVTPTARKEEAGRWQGLVEQTSQLIAREAPKLIVLPHAQDHHPAHVGTYWLVQDALELLSAPLRPRLLLTEFWQAMPDPNLIVESSEEDLAFILAALMCHVGEVNRNPYHRRLLGWMIDNVRRGAELVGGFGSSSAPDFSFGTLYRLIEKDASPVERGPLACSENAAALLGE